MVSAVVFWAADKSYCSINILEEDASTAPHLLQRQLIWFSQQENTVRRAKSESKRFGEVEDHPIRHTPSSLSVSGASTAPEQAGLVQAAHPTVLQPV